MKYPRLLAAILAVSIISLAVTLVRARAHRIEVENERRVTDSFFPQKLNGSALQRLAFKMRHVLPIYGSSELGSYKLEKDIKALPGDFFIRRPTGFATFPIGRGGTTPLVFLQDLAAIRGAARDHKVVVVLSPSWFTRPLDQASYGWNASVLHSACLVFGDFSDGLKHDVCRRLLQFPKPLEKSVLLKLVVENYANGGWWQLKLAHLLSPVGRVWIWFLDLMDDLATVQELHNPTEHFAEPGPPEREPVNWDQIEADSEQVSNVEAVENSNVTSNGKEANVTPNIPAKPVIPWRPPPDSWKKAHPPKDLFSAGEVWGDYDLLLRTLKEAGVRPLILSVPLDGITMDRSNEPYHEVRRVYYDRVREKAAHYGFPVFTFEEHEYDGNFLINHAAHLTDKGWLYFDQVIDAFYHDKI